VGWGRVYEGYLLLGKLVGEPAPTKFIAFIRKISICVNPHLRLSAFICGLKKTKLHGRGGFANIFDNHRQMRKTRPDAVPIDGWGGGGFIKVIC
jgi:hypothetical protein